MQVDDSPEDFVEVSITKGPLTQEQAPVEGDDDGNKIDSWLAAVLVVVCVIVVAGALVLLYFLILRKKTGTNTTLDFEDSRKEI